MTLSETPGGTFQRHVCTDFHKAKYVCTESKAFLRPFQWSSNILGSHSPYFNFKKK